MRREHGQARAVGRGTRPGRLGQLDLDSVDAAEHEALAGERDLVPFAAAGELVEPAVVLLRVGAYAQEPSRALDQADRVVAAPAEAVLDLDRRERRLAGVAPVDVSRPAVDEPRLEQRQEQPLRPAVHDRVRAHERPLPVEREAEALELPGHVLGATRDPLARRHAAGDRAELGGQAEGVEAEGKQHRIPACARETCVGIADRVGADVADVDVARGEGGGGLDVLARLPLGQGGGAEGVVRAPGGLATGLDRLWVVLF